MLLLPLRNVRKGSSLVRSRKLRARHSRGCRSTRAVTNGPTRPLVQCSYPPLKLYPPASLADATTPARWRQAPNASFRNLRPEEHATEAPSSLDAKKTRAVQVGSPCLRHPSALRAVALPQRACAPRGPPALLVAQLAALHTPETSPDPKPESRLQMRASVTKLR